MWPCFAACRRCHVDSWSDPFSWSSTALLTCSSADIVTMVCFGVLEALMVLAESLVVVEIAVLDRESSWSGDVRGRPLGESSERRFPSADGLGDGCPPGRETSVLSLLGSKVERVNSWPVELDGLLGGEGGSWPPENPCEGLGGSRGAESLWRSNRDARCRSLPRGRENLE